MAGEERSHWQVRIAALQRGLMWRLLAKRLDLVCVSEFPRSGGSWISTLIAEYLSLPFPRNRRPKWESAVLHGHQTFREAYRTNSLFVLRDGRDVFVSLYFHLLFHNDHNASWAVDYYRDQMPFSDYQNVEERLPDFIEHLFEQRVSGPFKHRWDEFVLSWSAADVPCIRYEEMLLRPTEHLTQALEQFTSKTIDQERLALIVETHSFKNVASRRPGKEDEHSFVRKGIAGDWKTKFTRRAKEVFHHYAGYALIELGYEEDSSWIS